MNIKQLFVLFILLFSLAADEVYAQRQAEWLDRGLYVARSDEGIFVGWRLRSNEKDAAFNVYKNGKLWKKVSAKAATNVIDAGGSMKDLYQVRKVENGQEVDFSYEMRPQIMDYFEIPLQRPEAGRTIPCAVFRTNKRGDDCPDGDAYKYVPGEGAVGDLDGDGEYDIIVKWNPSPAYYDNGKIGVSGEQIIDAYKMDGTLLWRIHMGQNIRAGEHYTMILVYDFDGDGKAEVVMRTAPGTRDGKGKYVLLNGDDPTADYRVTMEENRKRNGCIKTGPEYLTVFRGIDGAEICSCPYTPERGDVNTWGDDYGNRADRFLAAVAYLDGVHPSIINARGYYMKSAVAAYYFDGKSLTKQWEVVSDKPGEGIWGAGNHNISVGDVDFDGKDEVVHGNCAIDDDGKVIYNTNLLHGDAMHLGVLDPTRKGLQVLEVHEEPETWPTAGMEMHDALTGEVLWKVPASDDNGKGIAADIDPTSKGHECWSYLCDGLYNCKGKKISDNKPKHMSFRTYWDGDLLDELYAKNLYKWDWDKNELKLLKDMTGCEQSNGTKMVPFLQADLFGDWREEIISRVKGRADVLRVYSTTIPTDYRLYTLMDDPQYRVSVAWQNISYNQPPHLSFWLAGGEKTWPWPVHNIIRKK